MGDKARDGLHAGDSSNPMGRTTREEGRTQARHEVWASQRIEDRNISVMETTAFEGLKGRMVFVLMLMVNNQLRRW